ncbi:hypothetical protein P5673_005669 [Acropora cervicornis]|uniref:ZAD domain-containing protein n=1 Tax=Acropora cervicornis TaxID=6130 RepID=A0AAD9QYG2_ACRCE|nr:hypothetical protein P5673_005669 [Acropora cervicornis]
MAEPPKTPTKAASRVCRTCNENIFVKNHPLDLFGAKALKDNIPSVLERFFELKIAFDDGLPSFIRRCCHHKLVKFQEFLRKIAFSRQQQESVLRVKRGKTTAESPSGRSPQTRRDLKKRRINDDAPAKGPSLRLFQMDKPSKTRPRTLLPAPSAEGDGKKRKLPKRTESSAEPSTPPKQEEILSQSGLLNPLLKDVPFLEEGTKTVDTLATLMLTGCTTHQIAEIIMQCQPLRNAIKFFFLKDVNEQCQKLCNRSAENSSLLRIPPSKHKELKNFSWEKVITEMMEHVPDVLDVLVAVGIPNVKAHEDSKKQIAPLCTAYGILMFTRWKELSLIQKMNSILLSTGHATERTMKRLNRAGVTVTRETYRSIMDDIGSDLLGSVVILLQKSEDFKVLAVGKVIEVDAHISVPKKHVPVFVASIEECASGILAPGSAVFWPTDLIAVYKSPTMETAEISQPSNSNLNTYGLKECCTQYDNECGIHPESTKHTHACTTEDVKAMLAIVQQAKPFQYQRGRKLYSFPNVTKSPLDQLDVALLNTWLTNHKRKLFSGIHDCNEEDNDEENELSNGDDNTPEEDDLDD